VNGDYVYQANTTSVGGTNFTGYFGPITVVNSTTYQYADAQANDTGGNGTTQEASRVMLTSNGTPNFSCNLGICSFTSGASTGYNATVRVAIGSEDLTTGLAHPALGAMDLYGGGTLAAHIAATGSLFHGNADTATNLSTSGTSLQVWGMNSGATAQGWQTALTTGVQVICRQTVPWGNTGGVSATEDPTDCTIPANSMGANSFLVIHADVSSCTGSSAPWSGCTTNTGTCAASIYMSTTNTGSTLTVGTSTAIAATKQATMDSTVSNANSTSAQTVDAATMTGSNTIILTRALGSLNTTGTLYVNFYMTNSVSGDHCFYDDYRVTLY
jgi:hypothetical protein